MRVLVAGIFRGAARGDDPLLTPDAGITLADVRDARSPDDDLVHVSFRALKGLEDDPDLGVAPILVRPDGTREPLGICAVRGWDIEGVTALTGIPAAEFRANGQHCIELRSWSLGEPAGDDRQQAERVGERLLACLPLYVTGVAA